MSAAVLDPRSPSARDGRGHPERVAAPTWGLGAATTCLALLASGVRPAELALFAGFQLAFAALPGLLVYRLLVGRPRLSADCLALALPFGLALQIGFFVLGAAIGERWLFSVYPLVLVFASAGPYLNRAARAHSRAGAGARRALHGRAGAGARRALHGRADRPSGAIQTRDPSPSGAIQTRDPSPSGRHHRIWRRAPGLPPSRLAPAVLSVTAAATLVVYLSLFATSPLPRSIHSVSYYPDLVFNVSLTAELLHQWPFLSPSVSGVDLHYHLFVNVAMAAAAQVTRIDLSTIVMRLEPAFLVGLIGLQLFSLGRRVAGNLAGGLIALTLGLFGGELNFSRIELAGGGIPALGFLFSPSYQLGAVFFLAICTCLVHLLDPTAEPPRVQAALALALLAGGASGAKSSVLPVLIAGLALFALAQAPWRSTAPKARHGASPKRLGGAGPEALGGARSEALGDTGSEAIRDTGSKALGGVHILALTVLGAVGLAGYLVIYRGGGEGVGLKPLNFLAYSGFASIYQRAHASSLDALLAGIGAIVVLCALMVSLLGVFFIADRWLPARAASSPERLLLCMFAVSVPPFAMLAVPGDSQVYFVVYGFLAAVVVSAAGIASAWRSLGPPRGELWRPARLWARLVGRLPAGPRPRRELLALGAIALAGLSVASQIYQQSRPPLERWLDGHSAYERSGLYTHRGLTAQLLRGLIWLRTHSPSSAVIAVNNHTLGGDGGSRYVYYSAFSERRVFLESWQYTPPGARYVSLGRTASPFPRLLALNNAAVLDAEPAAISTLYDRYGVRYILIDRLHGPSSPNLGRVARLVYSNPAIALFQIA